MIVKFPDFDMAKVILTLHGKWHWKMIVGIDENRWNKAIRGKRKVIGETVISKKIEGGKEYLSHIYIPAEWIELLTGEENENNAGF